MTFEEALWLARMSRGRLFKDPLELGMPEHVRIGLLAKGLAAAQGSLLEITTEGLAEATRRGDPPTQDALTDRGSVLVVVVPVAGGAAAGTDEAQVRQRRLSANLLRIAVEAAIIDHEVARLNAANDATSVAADVHDGSVECG